jgi:hypothetical protein
VASPGLPPAALPPVTLPPPHGDTGGPPRALLSLWLSLMLILLAVFIVLVAQTRPRGERTAAALASLATVFGHDDDLGDAALSAADGRRRSAAATVEALVADLLALGPEGIVRLTPTMDLSARVVLPREALFGATAAVNGDAARRLDRIAAAAGALPAGYRLGIVVTVAAAPGGGHANTDAATDLAAARAVALGDALIGRGLPADAITLGIDDGATSAVALDFTAGAMR